MERDIEGVAAPAVVAAAWGQLQRSDAVTYEELLALLQGRLLIEIDLASDAHDDLVNG
jgi:hypothetical protein